MCIEKERSTKPNHNSEQVSSGQVTITDGLMGTERTRTIVISILLFIFCWFAFGAYVNALKTSKGTPLYNAYIMVIIGVSIILLACFLVIIYAFCAKSIKCLLGIIFMIGGGLYFVGYCFIMDYFSKLGQSGTTIVITFAEAILPSFSTFLMGLDLIDLRCKWINLDIESIRLKWNLLAFLIVSIMLGVCYAERGNKAGIAKLKTGYVFTCLGWFIIFVFSSIYFFGAFFKICNWSINFTLRFLNAIFLMIGGVITGIGYWILVFQTGGFFDQNSKWYYLGYAIFIVGMCITWGLDMGLLDKEKPINQPKDEHKELAAGKTDTHNDH